MFKVIFFYHYLLAQKMHDFSVRLAMNSKKHKSLNLFFVDPFVETNSVSALTTTQTLFTSAVIHLIILYASCIDFNMLILLLLVFIVLTMINSSIYSKKNIQLIIKQRPKFFGNHYISVILCILISALMFFSFLFEAFYVKDYLTSYCNI